MRVLILIAVVMLLIAGNATAGPYSYGFGHIKTDQTGYYSWLVEITPTGGGSVIADDSGSFTGICTSYATGYWPISLAPYVDVECWVRDGISGLLLYYGIVENQQAHYGGVVVDFKFLMNDSGEADLDALENTRPLNLSGDTWCGIKASF